MSEFDPREVAMNALMNPISTPVSAGGRLATNPFVVGQGVGTLPSDMGIDLSNVGSMFGLNDDQQQLQKKLQ